MALYISVAHRLKQANSCYIPTALKIEQKYSVVLKIQYFHISRYLYQYSKQNKNNSKKQQTKQSERKRDAIKKTFGNLANVTVLLTCCGSKESLVNGALTKQSNY